MLKTLIKNCDSRELASQLSRSGTNSVLYEAFSDANRLTDIITDTRSVLAPGYRLIRVDQRVGVSGDGFEIALLNDVDASVAYYSKVEVAITPEAALQATAQCFVWRSPDARYATVVREVALRVFFNYIVERYDVILSDNQETGVGRFFWQRQASTAIAYGLRVSYLEPTEQLRSIPTQEALSGLIDQLCSEANERKDNLVVISKARRPAQSVSDSSGWEGKPSPTVSAVTLLDTNVAYDLIDTRRS